MGILFTNMLKFMLFLLKTCIRIRIQFDPYIIGKENQVPDPIKVGSDPQHCFENKFYLFCFRSKMPWRAPTRRCSETSPCQAISSCRIWRIWLLLSAGGETDQPALQGKLRRSEGSYSKSYCSGKGFESASISCGSGSRVLKTNAALDADPDRRVDF